MTIIHFSSYALFSSSPTPGDYMVACLFISLWTQLIPNRPASLASISGCVGVPWTSPEIQHKQTNLSFPHQTCCPFCIPYSGKNTTTKTVQQLTQVWNLAINLTPANSLYQNSFSWAQVYHSSFPSLSILTHSSILFEHHPLSHSSSPCPL